MEKISKSTQKWINIYKHLPLDDNAIKIFNEVYSKQYNDDINRFKAVYFQTFVDINLDILNVGDEVYYVFGKSLSKGVIEDIEEFKVGYTIPRIKIKGKKKNVWNYQVVKC